MAPNFDPWHPDVALAWFVFSVGLWQLWSWATRAGDAVARFLESRRRWSELG